ncbi:MAG TPA: Uma2 family endonuclease [Bryobacteraceae bacterium]|nr:Uma2 family endonuclease [Bryobacteraceae bacterium]
MVAATPVSLEEYLSTSYDPDCEYAEGRVLDRHVGEFNHSFLQVAICVALREFGLRAYTELRCQVKPARFRVPDVLALARGEKRERRYMTSTPYIVVEILSPPDAVSGLRDTVGGLREKIDDYVEMGIPNIWTVDPDAQTFTIHRHREAHSFTDRITTSDGAIALDPIDIFRRMTEDEAQ